MVHHTVGNRYQYAICASSAVLRNPAVSPQSFAIIHKAY